MRGRGRRMIKIEKLVGIMQNGDFVPLVEAGIDLIFCYCRRCYSDNVGHLLVVHSGPIQYTSIYITPPVFSFIPAGCRMFSPTRTLTACKLLVPFLICLHTTRVIAIYTKTTHPSSLGHRGCIIDVATL